MIVTGVDTGPAHLLRYEEISPIMRFPRARRLLVPAGLAIMALGLFVGLVQLAYEQHWFYDPLPTPVAATPHLASATAAPVLSASDPNDYLPVPFPPSPTPEPTATPMPAPAVAAPIDTSPIPGAPARASAPPPAPPVVRFRIVGPGASHGIAGSVGNCTATVRTVPYGGAYYDICQPGLWFDCHISVCGDWNSWGIGTAVTYYDGSGVAHVYHITSVQFAAPGQRIQAYGSVHFQVCTNAAGTEVRVLGAA